MKCFECSTEIKSQINCSLCDYTFCSDSCKEAHKITFHRISKHFKSLQITQKERLKLNSNFLTKGVIQQVIKYDPIYKLENFDQVMTKKNKPKIIGSGSYGQVFLCKNRINQKHYAIKHMDKKKLKKSLKTLSGIYTEIDLQSRISHPNIVQLLYVKETDNTFDLVMECAIHGSLFDYIRIFLYIFW